MKKLFPLLVLVVAVFSACNSSNTTNGRGTSQPIDATMQPHPLTSVVMTAAQPTYALSTQQVTVTLTNNTRQEVTTGYHYSIDRQTGNGWENIPLNIAFIEVAIILQPGEAHDFEIDLHHSEHSYTAGRYRVVKRVSTQEESHDLSAEFRLQ